MSGLLRATLVEWVRRPLWRRWVGVAAMMSTTYGRRAEWFVVDGGRL